MRASLVIFVMSATVVALDGVACKISLSNLISIVRLSGDRRKN
jgi:hypothetical protein